jgi:uncharacterized protein (DUF1501 family)
MLTLGSGMVRMCSGITRRDFLRVGGLGSLGLTIADLHSAEAAGPAAPERAVILLMLVGGPSQLETWDPKPDAPAEIRGPFRSIATAVPGIHINEYLPWLAQRLDRLTLIRSLHHDAAPIHETGQQLLQTGRICGQGVEHPHIGSVVAHLEGSQRRLPRFVMIPGPIGNTGVSVSHGQTAGPLHPAHAPFHVGADPASPEYNPHNLFERAQRFLDETQELPPAVDASTVRLLERRTRSAFDLRAEPGQLRDAYGRTTFGQSCLLARRLVEAGVRLVTVNMFETVFNAVTWDCHGARPFSTLNDYAQELLPTFDRAFSALIDDLDRRGLLDTTLVVATGEFGRTPRLNAAGGRDHWPGVWSAALAGGGTTGGQVIGSSGPHASEPADRPVSPADLVATMYRSLGIDPSRRICGTNGEELALTDGAAPIAEAFV